MLNRASSVNRERAMQREVGCHACCVWGKMSGVSVVLFVDSNVTCTKPISISATTMPPPYPPRRPRPPAYKKYTCFLGPLTLFVRETSQPNTFDVRVTHKPRARTFEQALVIRPGTILCLHTARGSKYVRARIFNPRIQYGRLVASGTLVVDG